MKILFLNVLMVIGIREENLVIKCLRNDSILNHHLLKVGGFIYPTEVGF